MFRTQIAIVSAVFFFFTSLFAQPAENSSSTDTTLYDFFILDTRYQHQFTFWGRNYGQPVAFSTASLIYYFSSNLWLGASGFHFFAQEIPGQLGLSAGWYGELSARTTLSASYSQFYIPNTSVPASSRSQAYAQTTFGLDWGLLYSTLQTQLLINDAPDVFFTTNHSRYFQFNSMLFKKIRVSFEPKLSFTFGTNRFDYRSLVVAPGGGVGSSPAAGRR